MDSEEECGERGLFSPELPPSTAGLSSASFVFNDLFLVRQNLNLLGKKSYVNKWVCCMILTSAPSNQLHMSDSC